ncbi:MAG: TRAP transporter small permease subunit [Zoogloeaceae bacterium]|nr:TRAP transporter small permease subunit [Zoogloeaceae bacterium]
MQGLISLSRFIDGFTERVGKTVLWLVLAAVVISAINAIVRKTLNIGSNAFLEIQWYLFSAVFLIGSSYTMLRQGHVKIDVVVSRFSKRTQTMVECFGIVAFLFPFCFKVITLTWPLVVQAFTTGEMSENAGGLMRWPVYALVPLGFSLLWLQGLSELIKRIGFLNGLCADPSHVTQDKSAEEELAEEIRKHQVAPEVVTAVQQSDDMVADLKNEVDKK